MEFLNINKVFANTYYAVPDYQRDYEWTNAQNSTLLDDIFNIMFNDNVTNHFFGAIVTIPFDKDNATNISIDYNEFGIDQKSVKHIVDGQQRLTSFSILLKSILDLIENDSEINDEHKSRMTDAIKRMIFGTAYNSKFDPAPMLALNGNTGRFYNSEILKVSDNSNDTRLKGARRINSAYKMFKAEIPKQYEEYKTKFSGKQEYYAKLINVITQKIDFVEIACDESSDAFQVFDSLNGKGLDLTAADRIKNIFISWSKNGSGVQKWDALVAEVEKDTGKELMTSFFTSLFFFNKKKRISKNKLPDEFKKAYKEAACSDFDYFYKDLEKSGKLYGMIRNAKTADDSLNNIILDYQALGIDQVYVLLFAVAKHYEIKLENKESDKKEYTSLAMTLQKLIVRMQVCDKNYNRLDAIFSEYIELMKNSSSIAGIISKIETEISILTPDDIFKESFVQFCPNENRVSEFYCRYIENEMRREAGNRNKVDRGLTVEHIIPQTLGDLKDWYDSSDIPDEIKEDFNSAIVQNIGNKALLFGDDNSSANNNNYKYKLNVYENGKRGQNEGTPISTFKMIEDVVKNYQDKFLHTQVQERAKRLAEYAVKIW